MRIGSRPGDMFFVVCWSRVRESLMGRKMWMSNVCFACLACLAWLYELFVGTLISLRNAGCGRPTLNFIEHFDSEATSPCVSRAQRMYRMLTSLAWIWTWRCFEFFVFSYIVLSFFVLFYATLLWNSLIMSSVFIVIIICCLDAMKIKDSVEQMTLYRLKWRCRW